ncbi:MAG TPA: SRPBCC family protein [Acidobacteriaceae bacterium]
MLIYIVTTLAVIIIAFLVVASRQPDVFRVERSTAISAPLEEVFVEVNDFRKWQKWSPFAEYDPEMKITYTGAASGEGAEYAWTGNSKAGQGRMTILESRPSELIRIRLEFTRPFAATNTAEFTFDADGNQTLVTWAMIGKNNFMFKAMHTVMNMDKMVGGDFARGLAKLKLVVETGAR